LLDHAQREDIQGVIKIGGNILSRKAPRHLKMICDGWNCVFENLPHSGPWSTLMKRKRKWNGKKISETGPAQIWADLLEIGTDKKKSNEHGH
jgi:hypothetical protein